MEHCNNSNERSEMHKEQSIMCWTTISSDIEHTWNDLKEMVMAENNAESGSGIHEIKYV